MCPVGDICLLAFLQPQHVVIKPPVETLCKDTTCPGVHGPAHLDTRVDAFLGGYEASLAALEPDALERHRVALIAAKLQKDRGLADEASRHWEQIVTRRCRALHARTGMSMTDTRPYICQAGYHVIAMALHSPALHSLSMVQAASACICWRFLCTW